MKAKIEKIRKSKYGNLFFIIVGFSLLFALMVFLQGCTPRHESENQSTIVVDTTTVPSKAYWMKYYGKVHVKESGMHYIIYTVSNGTIFQVVNITKDSLEVEIYKGIIKQRNEPNQ